MKFLILVLLVVSCGKDKAYQRCRNKVKNVIDCHSTQRADDTGDAYAERVCDQHTVQDMCAVN